MRSKGSMTKVRAEFDEVEVETHDEVEEIDDQDELDETSEAAVEELNSQCPIEKAKVQKVNT